MQGAAGTSTDYLQSCRDAFDAVYGSSAGAINATYFLSGQREGVNIYTDDIACKEFIDLGRLLNFSGKPQGEPSAFITFFACGHPSSFAHSCGLVLSALEWCETCQSCIHV